MVTLAIDRISEGEVSALLRGRRLGVISAASGVSASYRYPMDILREAFDVRAFFAPEHGPRGVLGPGEKVSGGIDRFTSVPTYSLFGDFVPDAGEKDAYSPSAQALEGIDCVVFEMQDVGSRYFTYASTLFCAMKACGKKKLPLVLLDRPNPLGGRVEGSVSEPEYRSFIGMTAVPIRHGMTLGELARFYNEEYALGCDLTVVPVKGWDRDAYFDETGLPFTNPSPNLPTFESVLVYNGTCLFAGTNVSDGRGTTTPFTTVGAPYIDPIALADRLNADPTLHGVRFSPAFFSPHFSKHAGEELYGVRLHVTDKRALEPVRLGVTMLCTVREMYPDDFAFLPPSPGGRWHIDLSSGNTDLRDGILSAEQIVEKWNAQAKEFAEKTEKYRLY